MQQQFSHFFLVEQSLRLKTLKNLTSHGLRFFRQNIQFERKWNTRFLIVIERHDHHPIQRAPI